LTFDEAAAALGEGLHRQISHVKVSPQKARQFLIDSGMTENSAGVMLEMYDAVDTGRLRAAEARSPESTTPTTLVQFAREVMLSLLPQAVMR